MHEFQINGLSPRALHFLSVSFPLFHHGLETEWYGLNFGTLTVLPFPQQTEISPTVLNTPLPMIDVVTINEMYRSITIYQIRDTPVKMDKRSVKEVK